MNSVYLIVLFMTDDQLTAVDELIDAMDLSAADR